MTSALARQHRVVYMEPFGKARPRVTGRGTFMPVRYEMRRQMLQAGFGPVRVQGLIKLTVRAIRPMPASWSQARRARTAGRPAKPSPDIDNIVGAVMDALFPDNDDHVVAIEGSKLWGERAALEITLEQITEHER